MEWWGSGVVEEDGSGALVQPGDGGIEGIETAFEIVEPGKDAIVLLFKLVAEGEVAGGDAVVDFVDTGMELGASDVLGFGLWPWEEFFGDGGGGSDDGGGDGSGGGGGHGICDL